MKSAPSPLCRLGEISRPNFAFARIRNTSLVGSAERNPPLAMDHHQPSLTTQNFSSHEFLLSAIVDSSDDAIISKNLDGIITSWNKSAERIFGFTAAEAVGRPVTMLIPADRQNEEKDILHTLRSGHRVDHFETIRLRKDGSPVQVSLTISPVRYAAGQRGRRQTPAGLLESSNQRHQVHPAPRRNQSPPPRRQL